jgi:polysaccharide export outer membrane protein
MRSRFAIRLLSLSIALAMPASTLVAAGGRVVRQTGQDRGSSQQSQSSSMATASAAAPMTSVVVSPEESYRIGASDVIEVQVIRAPEISSTYRVDSDGTIMVPYIGTVMAEGRTARELAKLIGDGLRGDYLVNPQVAVSILQVNSKTYFIQGAVQRPGAYQIEGRPTLLELITVAGGLGLSYGSSAFIIRRAKPAVAEPQPESRLPQQAKAASQTPPGDTNASKTGPAPQQSANSSSPAAAGDPPAGNKDSDETPKFELVKVNINGLLRGNFRENVMIEPGDMIHIPPTDVFFVAGEVKAPGSFPLKEGTTLRQAISLAQGTTFEAAAVRGVIFRENLDTGKREEIHVDIKQVMSGKKEDVLILPNDVVIVPNSRFKSVGSTLLKAFGVSAAHMPLAY